jgi:hypothetical protein
VEVQFPKLLWTVVTPIRLISIIRSIRVDLFRFSAPDPGMILKPDKTVAALRLKLLAERVALCRFGSEAPVPTWTDRARQFLTVSRTPTELSVVADERVVPSDVDAQRGYHVLRVEGPLPLDLIGVFAALASPLAAAGVPIFPIATFDTDYLLVRDKEIERALAALRTAGHVIDTDS